MVNSSASGGGARTDERARLRALTGEKVKFSEQQMGMLDELLNGSAEELAARKAATPPPKGLSWKPPEDDDDDDDDDPFASDDDGASSRPHDPDLPKWMAGLRG